MTNLPYIQPGDVEHLLNWRGVSDAMRAGHKMARADIDDILFKHGQTALLNRAAWVQGLGIAVKSATLFPENLKRTPSLPSINSVCTLFCPDTGIPRAIIEGNMVTKWKTAGDSILGAQFLARPNSKTLLIVGAGTVATSLIDAYSEIFPSLENILIWNRTFAKAEALAQKTNKDGIVISAVESLAEGCAQADIISSATMSTEPVLRGEWVKAGTHVDLIGAYSPEMREADDDLIKKVSLFVDARETTVHDIGELIIPIKNGVITEEDVRADLYDLCSGATARTSDEEITLYKNGGGGHLDLMTLNYIYTTYLNAQG